MYSVGIGSRTGTNLDDVLRNYVRGIDYDESLAADLDQIRTRLDTDGLNMLDQRTDGRSFVMESAGVSATPFLRTAVNAHRSISFQLVPAEDKQEMWQWVLAFAVMVFVVAVLIY